MNTGVFKTIRITHNQISDNKVINVEVSSYILMISSSIIRFDIIHTAGADFSEDHVHHTGVRVGEWGASNPTVLPCRMEFQLRFLVLAEPERIA